MTAVSDGFVQVDGIAAADVAPNALHPCAMPNGTRLCVGRLGDAFFALKDSCPHNEYPLSEGTLYENGELECCWHGARFDCRSGAVLRGPAEEPLVMFDVQERAGTLWVRRARRTP